MVIVVCSGVEVVGELAVVVGGVVAVVGIVVVVVGGFVVVAGEWRLFPNIPSFGGSMVRCIRQLLPQWDLGILIVPL